MVAKRSRNGLAKSAKMAVDKWLDLPSDPLFKIFTKLNPIDMLLVVPLVCKNWGRILCEMLFYDNNNNSLNFRPLQHYAPFCSIFCGWGDDRSRAIKLMNLLVSVMHVFASDGDVGTSAVRATPINYIAFPPDLRLYDKHLVYIAERCPELKAIFLPCAENITGKGIARAMRFWTSMESMIYGPFGRSPRYADWHFSRTIEEIGINCKNLQSLHLTGFKLHWQSADIIVRNLKSLEILCLSGVHIEKWGLQIFLSRCKKLLGVKIASCSFVRREGWRFVWGINLVRVQEGRRNMWITDIYPDENDKLYTSKELVDLLWM